MRIRRTRCNWVYGSMIKLPTEMRVEIRHVDDSNVVTVVNNRRFGDLINDNNYVDDGYRFHDIFHISYATFLGWSPIIRELLGISRYQNFEDSKRARSLEEGIVAIVWAHAKWHSWFHKTNHVDQNLLSTLKNMTSMFEVGSRSEKEWERAILEGFRMWRLARENNRISFTADLENKTMTV